MGNRQVSWTEISTALTCFAQWDFQYGGRLAGSTLKRRAMTTRLTEGSAWGVAFQSWHRGDDDWTVAGKMLDAIRLEVEKASARAVGSLDAEHEAEILAGYVREGVHIADHVGGMMALYMERAERLPGLTMIEEEIVVPIFKGWEFLAYLDGHTVEDDIPWIVESKSRDSLMEIQVVKRLPQYRFYAAAYRRKFGLDPKQSVGVIVDETINRPVEQPKMVQAGKEDPKLYYCRACRSAPGEPCTGQRGEIKTFHAERRELTQMTYAPSHDTRQYTTSALYIAACEQAGVEPKQETVEAFDARVWHRRVHILFTPAQLDAAWRDIQTAALLIDELDAGYLSPVRNGSVKNCNSCRFSSICDEPDNDFVITQSFERGTPKRLMGEKPEGQR